MNTLHVNSNAGMILMKHARLLQGEDEGQQGMDKEQEYNEYASKNVYWMKDFSIKFLGCHHVASWNSNAQEDNDVRIHTQRFVRFRLCQTDSCSSKNSLGCSSGYGDYLVDMDTFVTSHVANLKSSFFIDGNGGNDNYYDYNAQRNMEFLEQYSQCSQYESREQRQLEENNENEFFIGPYCSNQGQDIHLGLFTDDTCTEFADSNFGISTYKEMTGIVLPYSKADLNSIVIDGMCHSCASDSNSYYDGQSSYITESCQNLYFPSAKCENKLSTIMGSTTSSNPSNTYPNNNGCKYIHGIRFTPTLSSGVIHRNRYGFIVSLFLALFFISFILLVCYIVYLKLELAKQKRTAKRSKRFTNSSPIKTIFRRRRSKSRSQSRDQSRNRNASEGKKHSKRRGFGFFGRKKTTKMKDNHTSLLS